MNEYTLTGNALYDYFVVGGASGMVGFLYYTYRNNHKESLGSLLAGSILSFLMSAFLSVVIDKSIEAVILTGLFSTMVYNTIITTIESKALGGIIKEILIKVLTKN